jgi:hypothetical protein
MKKTARLNLSGEGAMRIVGKIGIALVVGGGFFMAMTEFPITLAAILCGVVIVVLVACCREQ